MANLIKRPADLHRDEPILNRARSGLPLDTELVIDAHAHLTSYGRFYIPRTDAASIVEVMDRCGVRATAVSDMRSLVGDFREGNRTVAEAAEAFPGRFIGYATANPNYPLDEMEADLEHWLANHPWMRGIKLHPSLHRYPVTGPRYRPAYEAAVRHKVPLLSHTWGDGPEALLCDPAMFAGLAETYPSVPFFLGHSGGILPGYRSAIEVARRYPNVYLELCGSFQTMGLVEYLVDEVGPDKILFGSDVLFLALPAELGRVVYAKISTEDKRKILGLNAARLFNFT